MIKREYKFMDEIKRMSKIIVKKKKMVQNNGKIIIEKL